LAKKGIRAASSGAEALLSAQTHIETRDCCRDGSYGRVLYNISWAYDPQGRLDALTTSGVGSQKVVDFEWLPNDALEKITLANSAVTDLTYHNQRSAAPYNREGRKTGCLLRS
jgi:hypothetical protein